MRRMSAVIVLVMLVAGASHGAVLARDGKPAMVIAVSAEATAPEQFAVEELALHLEQIVGAPFVVVPESDLATDAMAIHVGHTRFAAESGIDVAALGAEEWLLRTVGDQLILTGGRPRGTLYAVYEFLDRELGVAWLSEEVTLLPKRPELTIGHVDRQGAPAFGFERYVHTDVRAMNHVAEYIELMDRFHSRNRIGSAAWLANKPRHGVERFGTPGNCHTFYPYLPPDDYFEKHPEWYSLNVNGDRMRGGGQLCLTNTEMRAELIRRLRGFIEQDRERAAKEGMPPPVRYDVSMNDYHNMCQCPECRAIVTREEAESGLVLDFVNAIAADIAGDFPELSLTTFAYSLTIRPPKTIRPRENVIIKLAYLADGRTGHNWRDPTRSLSHPCHDAHRQATLGWLDLGARIHVWDYWRFFLGDAFETPYTRVKLIQGDLQYLNQLGVKDGCFVEFYGADRVSFFALTRWLGITLMNDPYREVEPLITRFMEAWYGPAAGPMREWLEYLHRRLAENPECLTGTPVYRRDYMDMNFFLDAYAFFDKGEALCAPGSVELVRLWNERMPVDTALLGLWDKLTRDVGADAAMPWDRTQILERYAAQKRDVLKSLHLPQTLAGALTKHDSEVERLRLQMEQPPLPAAFRGLPPGDVVDILRLAGWDAPHHHRKVVQDAGSPGGVAIRLDITKLGETGKTVPLGVWSPGHFGPTLTLTPPAAAGTEHEWFEEGLGEVRRGLRADIPQDEAFHWYKLGPFTVRPGTLVHAHRTWYLSMPGLDRPLMLGYPEEEWYIFVAFKLEGPAYVAGSTREDALSIGRVILVRAGSPTAGDFMPEMTLD